MIRSGILSSLYYPGLAGWTQCNLNNRYNERRYRAVGIREGVETTETEFRGIVIVDLEDGMGL